jgi:hypothetical protein
MEAKNPAAIIEPSTAPKPPKHFKDIWKLKPEEAIEYCNGYESMHPTENAEEIQWKKHCPFSNSMWVTRC